MANEEYRKLLRAKNSELTQFKRENESLTKVQTLRIKELELVSGQD